MTIEPVTIESAFAHFLARGVHARDWPRWTESFTDDAVYTEHVMGRFVGRPAIHDWILSAMEPVACMTFSLEWWIPDGDRIAFWIWNHLPDPDESGLEFAFPNLSILTYAGDGRFSAEEDFYHPAWTKPVLTWFEHGGRPDQHAQPQLRPRTPSHPEPPADGDVDKAIASIIEPGWVERHRVVSGGRGVIAVDTPVPTAIIVHADADGEIVFRQDISNPS